MYILYIRQKFCASLSKKIQVNTCFGDRQKIHNDDLRFGDKCESTLGFYDDKKIEKHCSTFNTSSNIYEKETQSSLEQ